MVEAFYIPSNKVLEVQLLHVFVTIWYCPSFFILSILLGMKRYLIVVVISFPDDEFPIHVFVGHLYVFICGVTIQISCAFLFTLGCLFCC